MINDFLNSLLGKKWNAYECVEEMKNSNYKNWKQMEWQAFYFEYLFEKKFPNLVNDNKSKVKNVKFDLFYNYPCDLKTHSVNNSKEKIIYDLILNDKDSIDEAIRIYGRVDFIVLLGISEFDYNRKFKNFVDELKGEKSKYEEKNNKNNVRSRIRKKSFKIEDFAIYCIDNVSGLKTFNQGKNSNGKPRKQKYLMKLNYQINLKRGLYEEN